LGDPHSLKARPDGTVLDGHHRLTLPPGDNREEVTSAQKFPIPGPWRGRLAVIPRPRGGDWLEDEAKAWRRNGIDLVVSLLENEEAEQLDLLAERRAAESNGIQFIPFPIPDR
jgi:hypothetical protein